MNCVKAKTRCDALNSRCSECSRKGIACTNEQRIVHGTNTTLESQLGSNSVAIAYSRNTSVAGHGPQSVRVDEWIDGYHGGLSFDPGMAAYPSNEMLNSTNQTLSNNTSTYPWLDTLEHSTSPALTKSYYTIDTFETMRTFVQPCSQSLIHQPTCHAPRIFRPRSPVGSSPLMRTIIVNTLRMYTESVQPDHDLPPFIHRQAFDTEDRWMEGANELPVPLVICSTIVQMVREKSAQPEFIWNAVHTAQKWLAKKCHEYDDRHIVAALQAMTIYLILRTMDLDHGLLECDVALGQTMLVSCAFLSIHRCSGKECRSMHYESRMQLTARGS